MLVVISPAKKLDYDAAPVTEQFTQPRMLEDAAQLIEQLLPLAPHDVSALMHISDKLGTLNYERFQSWSQPFNSDNAKQALLAFRGDVYAGMDADSFSDDDFNFAQQHLRLLSGLYGLLRPLDLMQAYRLEMGTKFSNNRGKNLYEFWGDKITELLNQDFASEGSEVLINLASTEYFKSVKAKQLKAEIITPVFKERKGDDYKVVGIYAKKARGMMSRYIIQNQLAQPEQIKAFDVDGYAYNSALSTDKQWVFTRG
ncbi:Peroxide stress resistance protein YaaA [Sinobacterium norvegicum]|uniref:UPF0246 protein SIN8267_03259 n=1 Tax=Sinobacterium norvegicum TaxID=1641715 RepID=A0ABN8EPB4_9GAMM|nr:peroxide stress protein YaaA [Sinobacterium norvegicum]CAH0993120.1 Peroxide stress resistance protein YaaA [Sinobacterium norvegicum]